MSNEQMKLCKRGHPLTPDNIVMYRRSTFTTRGCRACHQMRQRDLYARNDAYRARKNAWDRVYGAEYRRGQRRSERSS